MKKGKLSGKLAEIAMREHNTHRNAEPDQLQPIATKPESEEFEERKGADLIAEGVSELFAGYKDQAERILKQRKCRLANAVPSTATESSSAVPLSDSKVVKQVLGAKSGVKPDALYPNRKVV